MRKKAPCELNLKGGDEQRGTHPGKEFGTVNNRCLVTSHEKTILADGNSLKTTLKGKKKSDWKAPWLVGRQWWWLTRGASNSHIVLNKERQ